MSFELELAGVDVRRLPVSFGGLMRTDRRRVRSGCVAESFDGVDVDWGDDIGSGGGGVFIDFICQFISVRLRIAKTSDSNEKTSG